MGQSYSTVMMGMTLVSDVDIEFPDQNSGPPRGCRSAAICVEMFRAMMEGQSGLPPL